MVTPHRMIFAHILSKWVAHLPSDGWLLDIGCGIGTWIEVSSRYAGRVVGLEVDKQACSIAWARVGDRCTGIVLYSGGAFPFKENSFQGAYAHEVIEHVRDDEEFIAEAYRILKDGSCLILTTPNARREPLDVHRHGAHVRHYLPGPLRSRLEDQDFEVEKLCWRMHPLCGMLDDALSHIGHRLLQVETIQPGSTHWTTGSQSIPNRFLLNVYGLVSPLIKMAVIIEFEIFKSRREARNMVFIARKGRRTNSGRGA